LAGLTPTPYQSGDETQEQEISKAGSRPIHATTIEIAWGRLCQLNSELSRWYERRFAHGSQRVRAGV
jgi:transposase